MRLRAAMLLLATMCLVAFPTGATESMAEFTVQSLSPPLSKQGGKGQGRAYLGFALPVDESLGEDASDKAAASDEVGIAAASSSSKILNPGQVVSVEMLAVGYCDISASTSGASACTKKTPSSLTWWMVVTVGWLLR